MLSLFDVVCDVDTVHEVSLPAVPVCLQMSSFLFYLSHIAQVETTREMASDKNTAVSSVKPASKTFIGC